MANYATGASGDQAGFSYGPAEPYNADMGASGDMSRAEAAQAEGFDTSEEDYPRTIYVGNLVPTVNEELIRTLFTQVGQVTKCKIIWEGMGNSEPYAFVEFVDHNTAAQALMAFNKRVLMDKQNLLAAVAAATAGGGGAMPTGALTPLPTVVQPQQQLLPTLSAFEGVPIFLVPNAGAANLQLLQKAALEMKVNWATTPGTFTPRVDTSKHYHIFVGDLSPEVDNKALHDAFVPFGEISDAKVIRDLQTFKSKGYGFVSYIKKEEAERGLEQMNGQWLGRRTIRTNWATRKPAGGGGQRTLSFDDVYQQTGPSNTSVYVGGIPANTTEDDLRKLFAKYGQIVEIRIFKQQGYSFIRFDNKEAATHAIVNCNGAEVCGQSIRCSWGRAGHDGQGGGQAGQGAAAYGYGYGYGGGAGAAQQQNPAYWQQYYQQYYNNPALMQQWQSYWQQQGGNQ